MGTTSFPETPLNADLEKVIINLNTMAEELDHIFGGKIDTKNIREIAGWIATRYKLQSKDGDVGFNTEDTVADDIRIWAGDAMSGTPKFFVTKSGKMTAQDAIIRGTIYALAGVIGGWTIELDKLSGAGEIEGGTITGSDIYGTNIYGANIYGGNIDVTNDVYIGKKLYMNASGFTSDIVFFPGGYINGDPGGHSVNLIASGGVYANGNRIDDLSSSISTLFSLYSSLESRVSALESAGP
jgi:hypothetical protein